MAAKGYALLVGVQWLEGQPPHEDAGTAGAAHDVSMMLTLLEARGFPGASIRKLVTKDATAENILNNLEALAELAQPGDLVVFYNSSHGGQVDNLNEDHETDSKDETICAYDRDIVDDELYACFNQFKKGVRVVFVNDACNSGTTYKIAPPPYVDVMKVHLDDWGVEAELIYYGGASDGTNAQGYRTGGAFTLALSELFYLGYFTGNYEELFNEITARTTLQDPTFWVAPNVSAVFRNSAAFTI
jgi:hypothetical protein